MEAGDGDGLEGLNPSNLDDYQASSVDFLNYICSEEPAKGAAKVSSENFLFCDTDSASESSDSSDSDSIPELSAEQDPPDGSTITPEW